MTYPSETQSALLFDRPFRHLDEVAQKVVAVLSARYEQPFIINGQNPEGTYYSIYGGNQVAVTLEYMPSRADTALFDLPLKSPITTILCEDMPARIDAHQCHVLINVSHGPLGNSPELAALLEQVNYPKSGATLAHFQQRLELCELLTLIVQEPQQAIAIHWTQSDQLLDPATFETYAGSPCPNALHVHPFLLDGGKNDQDETEVGVICWGSAHFVGRTVTMKASALPWADSYEASFVFLRVALAPDGYIIPDTDTFGNDDHSESYRVRHLPAGDGFAALYEIEPLLHKEYGFVSPTYVARSGPGFDDTNMPDDMLPQASDEREEMLLGLRTKRVMAESIGGRFDVRRVIGGRMVPPPEAPKPAGLLARIKGLGRK